MPYRPVTLKGMDVGIWKRIKVASVKKGMSMSKWLTEAARVKLRRENG